MRSPAAGRQASTNRRPLSWLALAALADIALVILYVTEAVPRLWIAVGAVATAMYVAMVVWMAQWFSTSVSAPTGEVPPLLDPRTHTSAIRRLAHRSRRRKADVLANGRAATAVVHGVLDGKRASQFRQLVCLDLEVDDGDHSYRVWTGELITAASAGGVVAGGQLHVRVDPHDPTRVAVDWERSQRLPTA